TLTENRTDAAKATESGLNETAKVEYGINEMFSAGISLGYSSWTAKSDPEVFPEYKIKGFVDPILFVNGRLNLADSSLRFGAAFSFSFEDNIRDASGNYNQATGGLALTPFVGYEMTVGEQTFGARLKYRLQGDTKSKDESGTTKVTSTTKGNNKVTLGLFYE